jgi:hypothetical protein
MPPGRRGEEEPGRPSKASAEFQADARIHTWNTRIPPDRFRDSVKKYAEKIMPKLNVRRIPMNYSDLPSFRGDQNFLTLMNNSRPCEKRILKWKRIRMMHRKNRYSGLIGTIADAGKTG